MFQEYHDCQKDGKNGDEPMAQLQKSQMVIRCCSNYNN